MTSNVSSVTETLIDLNHHSARDSCRDVKLLLLNYIGKLGSYRVSILNS